MTQGNGQACVLHQRLGLGLTLQMFLKFFDSLYLFMVLGAGDLRGGLAVFWDRGLELENFAFVVASVVGLDR